MIVSIISECERTYYTNISKVIKMFYETAIRLPCIYCGVVNQNSIGVARTCVGQLNRRAHGDPLIDNIRPEVQL